MVWQCGVSVFLQAYAFTVTVSDRASYLTGKGIIHTLIICRQQHLSALL